MDVPWSCLPCLALRCSDPCLSGLFLSRSMAFSVRALLGPCPSPTSAFFFVYSFSTSTSLPDRSHFFPTDWGSELLVLLTFPTVQPAPRQLDQASRLPPTPRSGRWERGVGGSLARDLALIGGGAGWPAPSRKTRDFGVPNSSAASSAGWFANSYLC